MRRYYITVAGMVAAGIAVSTLLIPREKEVALIKYKDKHFEEARKVYEEQMKNGDLNAGTVATLTELYLQTGDIDEAIAITERYIAAHPNDIEARKSLGTYYQYAQRFDDYVANLEALNRLSPTPEHMAKLSDIYSFRGEMRKQMEALKTLTGMPGNVDAKYYQELAHLQASVGNYPEAISTLRMLKEKHAPSWTFEDALLLVNLLLDTGAKDEALKEAKEWQQKYNGNEHAAILANTLLSKGSPTLAASLMTGEKRETVSASPELADAYIAIALAENREKDAYALLSAMDQAGTLPQSLHAAYMLMAYKQLDEPERSKLIERLSLAEADEDELTALAEIAFAQQHDALQARLAEWLETDAVRARLPVFAAYMDLAEGKPHANAAIISMDDERLTVSQRLMFARLSARRDQPRLAWSMLNGLPGQERLSDADIAAVASVMLALGEEKRASAWLAEARERHSDDLAAIRARLAASRGDGATVKSYLESGTLQANDYADLFFSAYNANHLPLATLIAERYHAAATSSESARLLAYVHLKSGRNAEAAALFREHLSPEVENDYVTALARLAPASAAHRQELRDFAQKRFAEPIGEQRKIALVYALLAAGERDLVMTPLRELAETHGGAWAARYAEELDKSGNHGEARRFWLSLAHQPSTTVERRREIAYTLLNYGDKREAASLFAELASASGPGGEDMKTYQYLIGPRASDNELRWLQAQKNKAPADQKAAWAAVIASLTDDAHIQALASEYPALLHERAFADRYAETLAAGADDGALSAIIAKAGAEENPVLLDALATRLEAHGNITQATRALEAYAALAPENAEPRARLGVMAASAGDYSAATRYLEHYFASPGISAPAARPLFTYAELLRRKKDPRAADYYQRAIDAANAAPGSLENTSILAQSLIALGRNDEGMEMFANAIAASPDDTNLLADRISVLLSLKRYGQADAEIAHALAAAAQTNVMTPFDAPAGSEIELIDGDRRALVHLSPGAGGNRPDLARNIKNHPWIADTEEGYDTWLIVPQAGVGLEKSIGENGGVSLKPVRKGEEETASNPVLRLHMLAARSELEQGRVRDANVRLMPLARAHPRHAELLGFTANAAHYGGNSRTALYLLKQAHDLAPDNEDITLLLRDVRRTYASHVRADYDWVKRGNDHEQIATVSGLMRIRDHVDAGFSVSERFIDAESVRRDDGRIDSPRLSRTNAELFAVRELESGNWLKFSLFANNSKAGGGGYYHFLNPFGETLLTLEFNRPYHEYTEAAIESATRSQVSLRHTIKPAPRVTVSVEPSVRRYDTDDVSNAATSIGAEAEAVLRLRDAQPSIAVAYGLDAEYQTSSKRRIDAVGTSYRPFPAISREVHFLSLNGAYEFSDSSYAEALAGYGYDRLGGSGPYIEGRFTHELTDSIDVQLRGSYGFDSEQSGNTVTRAGGYVRYRF